MRRRPDPHDVAVFARNHRSYLDEATKISARDPRATITFRARSTWATAERAMPLGGSLPIYMAAVGGAGQVEYEAELCRVQLDPQWGVPETEALLGDELPMTKASGEGLWEEGGKPTVRTLYAIRACRKLRTPFPMTSLTKLRDGKPISADYGYSYCVVRPHH